MRLISSDGAWDVLYDMVSLYIGGYDGELDGMLCIYAHGVLDEGDIVMGAYDSEEKLNAVMNDLHHKYGLMDTSVYRFPSNEAVMPVLKGWRK